MHQVELHSIQSSTHPDFPEIIRIYRQSFDISEQVPLQNLLPQAEKEFQEAHLLSVHFQGQVAGMISVFVSQNAPLAYLDYLAVAPELRSRGLGSAILAGLRRYLLSQPTWKLEPLLGICLEAADPSEEGIDDSTHRERIRRIDFYVRNGGFVLDHVDYFAPQINPNLQPPKYCLLVLPCQPGWIPQAREDVRLILDTILLYGYGISQNQEAYYRWK